MPCTWAAFSERKREKTEFQLWCVSGGQVREVDRNESPRNVLYLLDCPSDMICNGFASSLEVGDGLWRTGFVHVPHLFSKHTLLLLLTVRASVGTVFERFLCCKVVDPRGTRWPCNWQH
jgi:hypothetical protein